MLQKILVRRTSFIYSTTLPSELSPHEHAAVYAVVTGSMAQELWMSRWRRRVVPCSHLSLFPICLPPHWSASLLLTLLTLVPSPSHTSLVGGTALWRDTPRQWLLLSHRCFLPLGLMFRSEPSISWSCESPWERESMKILWGMRYRPCDEGSHGGGKLWLGPETCLVFLAVSSCDIFLLRKNCLQYWEVISSDLMIAILDV